MNSKTINGYVFCETKDVPEVQEIYDLGKLVATVTIRDGMVKAATATDKKVFYEKQMEYDWLCRLRNPEEREQIFTEIARKLKVVI